VASGNCGHRASIIQLCLFLPLVGVVTFASEVRSETYHVAPHGNDAASGLADEPWQTVQHAADHIAPGDVVRVARGTYSAFRVTQGGTMVAPVTFVADPGAIIDASAESPLHGINVSHVAWVVIEGFGIANAPWSGIRCFEADHVLLRGNVIRKSGIWGIFTAFCNDVVIEDNECSGSIEEHGIYLSNSVDGAVVRRNLLHDNNANGLHMNGDASQGGSGLVENVVVDANVIHGNGAAGGSGINCDGCVGAAIVNNLIYDTHASGISLYAIDAAAGSTDNRVVNNTVIVADDGRWALNIQDGSTGNVALNNILLNEHTSHGSISISADSLEGFRSDFNIVTDRFTIDDASTLSLAEWQALGHDASALVASKSELFVDGAGGDFAVTGGAVAVDAGTFDEAPSEDLTRTARPYGAGIDIGAFEYCEGEACGSASPEGERPMDEADERQGGDAGCASAGRRGFSGWLVLVAVILGSARRRRRAP
jgi:parallel beta-helix repeat protein